MSIHSIPLKSLEVIRIVIRNHSFSNWWTFRYTMNASKLLNLWFRITIRMTSKKKSLSQGKITILRSILYVEVYNLEPSDFVMYHMIWPIWYWYYDYWNQYIDTLWTKAESNKHYIHGILNCTILFGKEGINGRCPALECPVFYLNRSIDTCQNC